MVSALESSGTDFARAGDGGGRQPMRARAGGTLGRESCQRRRPPYLFALSFPKTLLSPSSSSFILLPSSHHGLACSYSPPSPTKAGMFLSRSPRISGKFFDDVSQPVAVRGLQTAADSTTLTEDASHSRPFTVKLHEDSFRAYRADTPSLEVEVSKDELLGMYKTMTTMRRMEMAADALYKQKLIRGFCHLAIGQVRPFWFLSKPTTSRSKRANFLFNF